MEEESLKEGKISMREFEMAWQKYFEDRPKPKNDEEEKKQLEEFHHWYNNVRKQSDTGKTPIEMYKKIYGKEPSKNPSEASRIMNFGWDEDSEEDEEVFDDLDEEDVKEMQEYFDKEIWPNMKKEIKGMTKKEYCFFSFLAGTQISEKLLEEKVKSFEEGFKKNPEEFKKSIDEVQERLRKNSET